ncbi:helix-turn-helix domain-containing protein [Microvirga splendida]|uniref:Helix-turn-helix domain-containing protein n=1 Tax=Microvirga splendida TaxID=2795727 RepID=A0ABS0Y0U2_9HYPH|nr:helix-turn-helix domain-containing protein [Microvirga splendida]MBJ6125640.1 hypothetical protein [Microvirga splendida]
MSEPDRVEISLEEAAKILGVSRALVRHRMDTGRLPFREDGTVRRVLMRDVLALKSFEEERRPFSRALAKDTDNQAGPLLAGFHDDLMDFDDPIPEEERFPRRAVQVEDLSPDEISAIWEARVGTDEPCKLDDLSEDGRLIVRRTGAGSSPISCDWIGDAMRKEPDDQAARPPASGHILVICGLGRNSAALDKALGAATRVIVLDAAYDTSAELRRHLAGLEFEIARTDVWQDMVTRGAARPEKVAVAIVDYTGSDAFRCMVDSDERVALLLPGSWFVRGAPVTLKVIQAG